MKGNVSDTLTKKQVQYKHYFDKEVCTIPTFTVGQQVYVDRPLLTLLKEDKRTSPRYNKLLSQITKPFTVRNVKSHDITINKNGTPNTISIDRATPVPKKNHVTKKINRKLCSPVQNIVPKNTDTGSKSLWNM